MGRYADSAVAATNDVSMKQSQVESSGDNAYIMDDEAVALPIPADTIESENVFTELPAGTYNLVINSIDWGDKKPRLIQAVLANGKVGSYSSYGIRVIYHEKGNTKRRTYEWHYLPPLAPEEKVFYHEGIRIKEDESPREAMKRTARAGDSSKQFSYFAVRAGLMDDATKKIYPEYRNPDSWVGTELVAKTSVQIRDGYQPRSQVVMYTHKPQGTPIAQSSQAGKDVLSRYASASTQSVQAANEGNQQKSVNSVQSTNSALEDL